MYFVLYYTEKLSLIDPIIKNLTINHPNFTFKKAINNKEFSILLPDCNPSIVLLYCETAEKTLNLIRVVQDYNSDILIIILSPNNGEFHVSQIPSSQIFDYANINEQERISFILNKADNLLEIHDKLKIHKKNDLVYNLIEQSSNAIFMGDNIGNFIEINTAASRLTGFSKSELLKMKMADLFSEHELSVHPLRYDLIIKGKTVINQRNIVKKNGHLVPVKMNSKIVDDQLYFCIMNDLTEVSEASNKLLKSEQKFRKLFNEAPDGIILTNTDGLITDCNNAFCLLIKLEKENILNTYLTNYINPVSKKNFIRNFQQLYKDGKIELELSMTTETRNAIFVRLNINAIYTTSDDFDGAIIHLHDITETKSNQQKISESEARLRAIFNAADNMAFLLHDIRSGDPIIVEFSPGAQKMFGYMNHEILEQSSNILYSDKAKMDFSINETTHETNKLRKRISMRRKSGDEFIALHTQYPVVDHSFKVTHLLTVIYDLSQTIIQENAIKNHEEQIQKMEAISLMANGIAHNFNNILQAIVGYIDFAKEGLDTKTQRYDDIDQISKLTNSASLITKELLAVGKEQFMKKNEIDLHDIIKPIVDLTLRNKQNKIDVVFNHNSNIPTVIADGSKIDQVILNLFTNAIDAMPNGGKISVKTDFVTFDDSYCADNIWAKPGNYVEIMIADTGHGMDANTLQKIFDPYFSTKTVQKGTGLGLSTAFGVISQHNGLINVISEVHKGTKFFLYLPTE